MKNCPELRQIAACMIEIILTFSLDILFGNEKSIEKLEALLKDSLIFKKSGPELMEFIIISIMIHASSGIFDRPQIFNNENILNKFLKLASIIVDRVILGNYFTNRRFL